ncbi:TolC family protein [Maribacter sp. BPC-D8]|uniref:TolC family protein n=1 Tax=Maribacter sp. BPC-D8 TaxID=3053613 RepID=UPI002B49E523|nr:TolC family protein [Maribacter sp. BPC-D8]WRI30705.1 TolC family protein [Maribacter sp. BPC-D8]
MKQIIIITGILCAHFGFSQEVETQVASKIWSLEDCISYAIENNITVKNAEINASISEVDYKTAKSAKLPNLFGSASQNFSNGTTIDPITSDYVSDQIHSTNLGVNSSMTLYQGNQLSNQVKQNKLLIEQNSLLAQEAKNNIVISILESYLQTLYSKEGITIAENNLTASEKEVLRAKSRLEAGTIALSDYTEAQSQAATNKYNVIAAKNDYELNIIDLKQLLELSPLDDLQIETVDENQDLIYLELNKEAIYTNALSYLPEVEASNTNILINEKELEIAEGGYLPTLSLTGSLGSGYTSIRDNNFYDQLDVNFNQRLGLSLSVPIFNRNKTKSAVQIAAFNIEKAEIQKQVVEKEVIKKVEIAYQFALSSQEQLVAAEASQSAAEQSYNLAQKRYELGDLSTTDLVVSQNSFTNAQQNYIQSKYLNILYHQLLQFYQGNDIKL